MRALSLLSGGIDSSTVTTIAAEKHGPENVLAVTFDYGQTLRSELEAARKVADFLGVRHRVVHIASAFTHIQSALLEASGIDLPHVEHDGTLPPTNVPFRNGIFLSVLAGMAMSIGASAIYYGAHADDHEVGGYPDTTPEFTGAMTAAIGAGTGGAVRLFAPLQGLSRPEVVLRGSQLNVPYWLTWSCYDRGEKHCGDCASCRERKRTFRVAGIEDPTSYMR